MTNLKIFKIISHLNIYSEIPIKNNMTNASLLCRLNSKSFYAYKKLISTKNELQNVSTKTSIQVEKLINLENKDYWIHLEMIEHFGKWISISVGKQISDQLKDLEEEENEENEENQEEQKKVINNKILKLNNKEIITRKEDGYINLNQICKAGGKDFFDWKKLHKTQDFLSVLSASTGIPGDDLIKYVKKYLILKVI